ncbi:MAG: nuclear transport factor 2 family protein [Thermodesulfobacteriota bacterium]
MERGALSILNYNHSCFPSEQHAKDFASHWIKAWNDHNIEAIISHYADDVEYFSVFSTKVSDNPSGTLRGKVNVKEYLARGLAAYPDLHFELFEVFLGVTSVVLRYKSVNNLIAAEVFEFDDTGLVKRVQCHYHRP